MLYEARMIRETILEPEWFGVLTLLQEQVRVSACPLS
jgi:hypothetical protein